MADEGDPMRPLLEMPKWDGKLVLAGIFILGYYALVIIMVVGSHELAQSKANIVRDAMLTLGPGIGLILGSIFRSTAAEERKDALRSAELRTAIETPSVVAPTVAPGDAAALGNQVEEGAREGTHAGVREALNPDPGGGAVGSDPTTAGEPASYSGPDLPPMPADLPANIRGA